MYHFWRFAPSCVHYRHAVPCLGDLWHCRALLHINVGNACISGWMLKTVSNVVSPLTLSKDKYQLDYKNGLPIRWLKRSMHGCHFSIFNIWFYLQQALICSIPCAYCNEKEMMNIKCVDCVTAVDIIKSWSTCVVSVFIGMRL